MGFSPAMGLAGEALFEEVGAKEAEVWEAALEAALRVSLS